MAIESPYERMKRQQAATRTSRPRLSEFQREQRLKANNIANRRALRVLQALHREQFNSLLREERAYLYGLIDAEYEAGGDRDIVDIIDPKPEVVEEKAPAKRTSRRKA